MDHGPDNPIRPFDGEMGIGQAVASIVPGNVGIVGSEESEQRGVSGGSGDGEMQDAVNKPDTADEDLGQARTPKIAARPYTPTKKEREEHEATDLPYRSWCEHCVFGKGVHSPHVTEKDKENLGATVSVDYCFMGGGGVG